MTKIYLTVILTAQCFLLLAAEAKLSAGQLEQAEKAYDKAMYGTTLKLLGTAAKTEYAASLLEAKTDLALDNGDAPAFFMRTAALTPQKSLAAMWRGYSLFLSRKYIPAKAELDAAVVLDAKNALAHALLGCCLCYLDEVDRGMAEIKKATQLDPKSNFNELIAISYAGAGESKKAEEAYNKLLAQNPKSTRLYIMRADFFAEVNKYAQALADYDHAVQLSPMSQYAYYRRARLLVEKGRYAQAIPDAQKGSSLEYLDACTNKSKRYLADAYDKTGQYLKAVNELKPLVAHTASKHDLSGTERLNLLQLTEDYEKLHDYKNAKSAVDIVCRLEPKSTEAIAKRARINSELGDYRNSLHDYNILILADPMNPSWYRHRAKVYDKLGKPESAKKDLKKGAELDD